MLLCHTPVSKLGGIATVGGQNDWDTRGWNNDMVQKGTFEYWYSQFGSFYNTDEMAELLLANLSKYDNVTILFKYDICNVTTASNPYRITSVSLKNIYRDSDDNIKWGNDIKTESCSVLIDASEERSVARQVNSVSSAYNKLCC